MSSNKYPKIGIGVMVKKENKVLLGLRKSSHASNCWCFPGGKQHFGETMQECAIRELKEETGLSVEKLKLISVADEMRYIKSHNKHFLNIGFLTSFCGGTPKVMEPDKCIEWLKPNLIALFRNASTRGHQSTPPVRRNSIRP